MRVLNRLARNFTRTGSITDENELEFGDSGTVPTNSGVASRFNLYKQVANKMHSAVELAGRSMAKIDD